MSGPLVFVAVCLLAIAGFAAGKERCAAVVRWLVRLLRAAFFLALCLGAFAIIIYGVVRVARLAWGSP